jgi:hypothetical protein
MPRVYYIPNEHARAQPASALEVKQLTGVAADNLRFRWPPSAGANTDEQPEPRHKCQDRELGRP